MAREFNGSTQYGRNSSAAAITGYPCSMSAWINPAATPSGVGYAAACVAKSAALEELWIDYTDDAGFVRVRAVGQGGGLSRFRYLDTTLTNGTWYHLTAVFTNATTYELYLNGSSAGMSNGGSASVTPTGLTDTFVGALIYNTSNLYAPFNGRIAEVGMWSAALTAAEAISLSKGFAPSAIRQASLEFYAPLIGKSSPEQDIVSGLSLTLTASPTAYAHPRVIAPKRIWAPSAGAAPTFNASWARGSTTLVGGGIHAA